MFALPEMKINNQHWMRTISPFIGIFHKYKQEKDTDKVVIYHLRDFKLQNGIPREA